MWKYGHYVDNAHLNDALKQNALADLAKRQVTVGGKSAADFLKTQSNQNIVDAYKLINEKLEEQHQNDSLVLPFGPGEAVRYRDATGRIHGELPEYPDPKMNKTELEEQANELWESIKAREIDNAQKGGASSPKGPQHRTRIDEERQYLSGACQQV